MAGGGGIHKSGKWVLARTVCSRGTFSRDGERGRVLLTPGRRGGVEGGPVGSGCNHPGQRSRPVLQGTMTNTADDKCSHSGQTLKEKANSQV